MIAAVGSVLVAPRAVADEWEWQSPEVTRASVQAGGRAFDVVTMRELGNSDYVWTKVTVGATTVFESFCAGEVAVVRTHGRLVMREQCGKYDDVIDTTPLRWSAARGQLVLGRARSHSPWATSAHRILARAQRGDVDGALARLGQLGTDYAGVDDRTTWWFTELLARASRHGSRAIERTLGAFPDLDLRQLGDADEPARMALVVNEAAFALQRAGAHARAIALLEPLVAARPDRTVAYLNLADSLWALGRHADAVPHYRTYAAQRAEAGRAVPRRVTARTTSAS